MSVSNRDLIGEGEGFQMDSSVPELLKEVNASPTPFDPTRVRAMKSAGYTVAQICAVFNITAGLVQKCTSTRLDKALRKSDRELAEKKRLNQEIAIGRSLKMQKSLAAHKEAGGTDPVNDFWVLLKVLHDQGMSASEVCQKFDLSFDDLKTHGVC
jgi:hypothetical protein